MKAIIFDIDGTIADCTHRLHYVKNKPKNWKAFFATMGDDEPIWPVVQVLKALYFGSTYRIVLCSGRPITHFAITAEWLAKHNIPHDKLYMRPAGDYRDDAIVKREILDQIRADGYDPFMAYDDRQRVVDMWREAGIVCAQVAPGDF